MSSSCTILLLFKVQIHCSVIFIRQDLVYFSRITSNASIFEMTTLYIVIIRLTQGTNTTTRCVYKLDILQFFVQQ